MQEPHSGHVMTGSEQCLKPR